MKKSLLNDIIFTLSVGLFFLSTQTALAAELLPRTSFRLSCVNADQERVSIEMAAIQELMEFAAAHDGEPVYLDVVIEADNGAGTCARDLATPYKGNRNAGEPRQISFNGCKVEKGRRCLEKDMAQIDADGPPLAYRHSIVLPRETALPKNLPYRMSGYGDWLNYQGPFIVRHYEGTGYAYATFHVPDAALGLVWARAVCNTKPETCH